MLEYCCEEYRSSNITRIRLSITGKGLIFFLNSDDGYGFDQEEPINFCPFCGTKLTK